MPVVIGLTGGIACGKSTVSQLLAERGATIVDADLIVRELQAVGSPVLQEMVDVFGPEILTETGELDRKGLGKIIFADPVARQKLNGILHPKVCRSCARPYPTVLYLLADAIVLYKASLGCGLGTTHVMQS